jgi:hypothetical protein
MGSVTIVANEAGPRVSISQETVRGLFKISHLY